MSKVSKARFPRYVQSAMQQIELLAQVIASARILSRGVVYLFV